MPENRVFISQATLDKWMSDGRVDMDGEVMTLKPDGQRFTLKTAVHILTEVTDTGDPSGLLRKVKDVEQLASLGGEQCADSVIVGETAYECVEGFVGEPVREEAEDIISGDNLAMATRAAVGDEQTGEIDLLARFFLSSGK